MSVTAATALVGITVGRLGVVRSGYCARSVSKLPDNMNNNNNNNNNNSRHFLPLTLTICQLAVELLTTKLSYWDDWDVLWFNTGIYLPNLSLDKLGITYLSEPILFYLGCTRTFPENSFCLCKKYMYVILFRWICWMDYEKYNKIFKTKIISCYRTC